MRPSTRALSCVASGIGTRGPLTTLRGAGVPLHVRAAGRSVYVILQGSVEVRHLPITNEEAATRNPAVRRGSLAALIENEEARQLGERVGTIPAGECFGELSSAGRFRDASVLSMGSAAGKAVIIQIEEPGAQGRWRPLGAAAAATHTTAWYLTAYAPPPPPSLTRSPASLQDASIS